MRMEWVLLYTVCSVLCVYFKDTSASDRQWELFVLEINPKVEYFAFESESVRNS